MTTSKRDLAYGRQGGRVVEFNANDPEPARCVDCDRLLRRSEKVRCNDCSTPAGLF